MISVYVWQQHLTCVAPDKILLEQENFMCILNRDIMTSDSHYWGSCWYLGLGRNTLDSTFYNRYLHVGINRCKLTGPGLPPYIDMKGFPSLEFLSQSVGLTCVVERTRADTKLIWKALPT